MNQCSLTNKVRTPVNRNMTAHSLASVIFSLYPSILTNEGHNFPGIFWPVSKRIFVQKHSYESKFPRTGSFGRKSDSFSNEKFCMKIRFHTGTRKRRKWPGIALYLWSWGLCREKNYFALFGFTTFILARCLQGPLQ